MKSLFNWRGIARPTLLTVGIFALLRAFGDPVNPMANTEWLVQLGLSLSVATACFYALVKMTKKREEMVQQPSSHDEIEE